MQNNSSSKSSKSSKSSGKKQRLWLKHKRVERKSGMALRSVRTLLAKPVLVVFVLIILLFEVTMEFILKPWSAIGGDDTRRAQFHVVCFAVLTGLTVLSYVACIMLSAGHVPKEYSPDVEGLTVLEVKRSVSVGVESQDVNGSSDRLTGDGMMKQPTDVSKANWPKSFLPRYCQKCRAYKPPRTHHCKTCRRCILVMDHHCAWINNCVGFGNYRAFVLMLFYSGMTTGYCSILLACCGLGIIPVAGHHNHSSNGDSAHGTTVALVGVLARGFSGLIAIPIGLAIWILFLWHCYLISHNLTTIEYHEGVRIIDTSKGKTVDTHTKGENESSKSTRSHPYDLGPIRNLLEVFGNKPWLWPLPLGPPETRSGIIFKSSI